MSFKKPKIIIEDGDTAILYLSINSIYTIEITPQITSKKGVLIDNILQTRFGALKPYTLIGKKYGQKIKLSSGWGYILQPTPELWTLTLPHRTQIIYSADISMILLQLNLKPGRIVIESGTGSGSLSHAILRTVKPSGHLHTFDFHELRTKLAQEEFTSHGLSDWVTTYHRDVCTNGFGDKLNGKADAVFLDLPAPWTAVPHAVEALKQIGGYICSFSPCIEQVQRTFECLNKYNFTDVRAVEIIQTERRVFSKNMPSLNLDYLKTEKESATEEEEEINPKKKRKSLINTSSLSVLTSAPPPTQTGHTGFLTFATLLPLWARK